MNTMQKYSRLSRSSGQFGYTLLEVMIAGFIGLLLLLGVMQIYLGASRTNDMQSSVIEVQDKGRFALAFLEKDLQRAGWSNINPGVNLGTLDSHIDFTQTTNGTGFNASDQITIRYEADADPADPGVDIEYDCTGALVANGDIIVNQYSVVNGRLLCGNGNTTTELLDNVESLQILYGVETTATLPDGIVDGYVHAGQIAGYQELVATVRLGILLRSSDSPLQQDNANVYQVLDTVFPAQDDRRIRRLFVKTILLPNKPQAF